MEELVGEWWHKALARVTRQEYPQAAVHLPDVQKTIGLLFRSAGGAASLRLATASAHKVGGPPGWLHRLAGSGQRAPTAQLEPQVLALPATLAVFERRELNHDLYLWLALQSAFFQDSGSWIDDNLAATRRSLAAFPGFAARYATLLAAHLPQRAAPNQLRGAQALAERAVQHSLTTGQSLVPRSASRHPGHTNHTGRASQAARRDPAADPSDSTALSAAQRAIGPQDVAAVWLWVSPSQPGVSGAARPDPAAAKARATPPSADQQRRRTQAASNQDARQAMLLPFHSGGLMTWSEHVHVNRGTDDEDDGNAQNAANDMEALTIAPDGQTLASRVKFDLDLPSASADDVPLGAGLSLPEWDYRSASLLPAHCRVQVMQTRHAAPMQPSAALKLTARRIRRKLETLRDAPRPQHGQDSGDDLDLDAWVRFSTDQQQQRGLHSDTPAIYTRRAVSERSLATLLLADLSLSTDAYASANERVIDVIRDALYVFGEALSAVGDPFAVWGFSSVRRSHVRLQHLKMFQEPWSDACRARVGAIRPGYYTRMGAAIRHATLQLSARPERRRLLMLLTDGKPNDLDIYEGRYGLEDTRAAIREAHAAGLTPFCVTIDETAHDYLPMLFGQQGYALVHRPQELVKQLTQAWATISQR